VIIFNIRHLLSTHNINVEISFPFSLGIKLSYVFIRKIVLREFSALEMIPQHLYLSLKKSDHQK
jgi:hypothetical protein